MSQIEVVRADLTEDNSDAIVNAANASLLGGGGVDGAIHDAGGPEILLACQELRRTRYPHGLSTGAAVATTAGRLPAKYVIHTVGPIYHEHPREVGAALLSACHRNSLDVADGLKVRSVAFPAISCGVYGWSPSNAAPIAVRSVQEWFELHPDTSVDRVRFVVFNEAALEAFAFASGPNRQ